MTLNDEFDTDKARTYPGLGRDFWDKFTGKRGYEPAEQEIDRCALIECPRSHHQFPSEDVSFFWISISENTQNCNDDLGYHLHSVIFYILLTGK